MPVAVVVLTWNSEACIEGCLRAAVQQRPAELVVVDNGSADGSVARVRAGFPSVRVIELGQNTGFCHGCNVGVSETVAPYVLFLNDDAVLEPGYLDTLVTHLERHPEAASAVGKLVWQDGPIRRIDSAGITMRWHALSPEDRGRGDEDLGQYDRAQRIFGPSCAAALYRREALQAAGPGPFDEALFAYYEDVDLAWRLGRMGYEHWYVPQAVAHHPRRGGAAKPPAIARRALTNRYRVWLKNERWWRFALYAPVAVPWEVARRVRRARPRRS